MAPLLLLRDTSQLTALQAQMMINPAINAQIAMGNPAGGAAAAAGADGAGGVPAPPRRQARRDARRAEAAMLAGA